MSKYLGIAYNLRLPPELKAKIAESAKSLNRSMNADIVARLEQSFNQAPQDNELERQLKIAITLLTLQGESIKTMTEQIEILSQQKTR